MHVGNIDTLEISSTLIDTTPTWTTVYCYVLIKYSAGVQVEHAKSVIATKYPQPITHPANSPFRVR